MKRYAVDQVHLWSVKYEIGEHVNVLISQTSRKIGGQTVHEMIRMAEQKTLKSFDLKTASTSST